MSDREDIRIEGTPFRFESELAKESFLAQIVGIIEKTELIESQSLTCGTCAAYPCFRRHEAESRGGLCYQEVRKCRQECDYFLQDMESGKAPLFIITGNCRKDNSRVVYEHNCKFI